MHLYAHVYLHAIRFQQGNTKSAIVKFRECNVSPKITSGTNFQVAASF